MKDKECTVTAIRNNPGIFYEVTGEVRTSEISWKTIIYVDIVRASIVLHREINLAIKKCNVIAEICTSFLVWVGLSMRFNRTLTGISAS